MFPNLLSKPAYVQNTEEALSSDGGLLLLRAKDQELSFCQKLAACIPDRRLPVMVQHPMVNLLRQRIFALASGYSSGSDISHLRDDAAWKELTGNILPSQATVSRFENRSFKPVIENLQSTLAGLVFQQKAPNRHSRRKMSKIILDMDGTDDPTHGQQEFSFFNGYFHSFCYMPLYVFASFGDDPAQHLVYSHLRPGNSSAGSQAIEVLKAVLREIRPRFPRASILVRMDAGFCTPGILDFLEAEKLQYIVAMAKNDQLCAFSAPSMARARRLSKASSKTERVYGSFPYQTRLTWEKPRRTIFKAEFLNEPGTSPKENPRFVVTNLPGDPEALYAFYCHRGDSENRIKELKLGLDSGRTSCHRFLANQFRLFLVSASYVLLQLLRAGLPAKARDWQVSTLRCRLLKVAVVFRQSVRRFLFRLPKDFPASQEFRGLCLKLGAVPV